MIFVNNEAAVGPTLMQIARLGLPRAMVRVSIEREPTTEALLTDYLRPAPGGALLQIYFLGGGGQACTLGYNLVNIMGSAGDPPTARRYFVTNSHCTQYRNALDGSQAYQGGYILADEVADPSAFNNSYSSACPPTYFCRFADAALYEYFNTSHAAQGKVAFPTLNTLSFSSTLTITGNYYPAVGYQVHMIGSRSGRRNGTVENARIDVWGIQGWPSGRFLCQARANYYSQDGDSGAPVVTPFSDGTAWATGIHWGRNPNGARWFSPIDNVFNEMFAMNALSLPGSWFLSAAAYP